MQTWEKASKALVRHLKFSTRQLDSNATSRFIKFLLGTRQRNGTVYLIGAGRSLDVLMIFGARLMKDPISLLVRPLALFPKPRIEDADAALVCSGTGETASVLSMIQSWVEINQNIGLLTSYAARKYASRIFQVVPNPSALILLTGITKKDIIRRRRYPTEIHPPLHGHFKGGLLVPSPTKFELGSLLFLESVITELYYDCVGDTNADTMPRH